MKSARSRRILQCGGGTLAILLAAARATPAASLFTTASALPGVSARADGPYTVGSSFMVGSQPLVVSSLRAMDTTGGALAAPLTSGGLNAGRWAPSNASFSTNAPTPPTPTSITNGLAGYWSFDETSRSTAAVRGVKP